MKKTDNSVKTLKKSLEVLDCFISSDESWLGITDIANQLNLNKSNVYDILYTYEKMGYLDKDPDSSKYTLSLKMLEFGHAVNQHLGYARCIYDLLQDLSRSVNQIVYFSVPRGHDLLFLYSVYPHIHQRDFPYRSVSGERCPLYCSSMGKAMLAFSSTDLLEQMKDITFEPRTSQTITNYEDLFHDIVKVRERGYALDLGESEYGVGAVGVPIFDSRNILIGAISICGVLAVIKEKQVEYSKQLKEAAFQIHLRI